MESAPLHLVFGATGQVGFDLVRELKSSGSVVGLSRREADLEQPDSVREAIRFHRPTVVWNAAAATAVDLLEDAPDLAFRVNATAPEVMAVEAKRLGAVLVHFSTDYVFDGTKQQPYAEHDAPNPQNVYGRSKLAGELAVQHAGGESLILRTSWVYSIRNRNFFKTILARGAVAEEIRVVTDQIGAPTWSKEIARACARMLQAPPGLSRGLFHLTSGGSCSWFDFAASIRDEAVSAGRPWLARLAAIRTDEYTSRARRPRNSVLCNARFTATYGNSLGHWRSSLAAAFREFDSEAPLAFPDRDPG